MIFGPFFEVVGENVSYFLNLLCSIQIHFARCWRKFPGYSWGVGIFFRVKVRCSWIIKNSILIQATSAIRTMQSLKNFRIHLIFRLGRILGNHMFRSEQKLYQEISRNNWGSLTFDPGWYFIDPRMTWRSNPPQSEIDKNMIFQNFIYDIIRL